MSNLFLEPAELSYLLQTINARSVVGLDNSQLFPQGESENNLLLKQGYERLLLHGWLTADPQSDKINFDPTLCYLIAIIADPDVAIVTMRQGTRGTYQLITHYLAGRLIVEQIRMADGLYQLAFVSDLSTTVSRIQSAIQPTEMAGASTAPQIFLNKQVFTRIKNLVNEGETESAVAELQTEGFGADLADSLVAAILTPTHQGLVMVMEREDGRITAKRNLTIMQSRQASWLLRMDDLGDSHVTLEAFWPQLFGQYLTGYLQNSTTTFFN